MTCTPAPRELSFQPLENGNPQRYFNFSADGLFPIMLPASKKRGFVVRDAKMVRLVMADPRFSLAGLDPQEDTVTGTGHQSPDGMLRLDAPRIRHIRRRITPLFSERRIAPWHSGVEKIADSLIAGLRNGCRPVDLNKQYFEPLVVRAVALSAGIALDESCRLYNFSNRVLVRVESSQDEPEIGTAWCELYNYIGRLLNEKSADPDDGLLSTIFRELKKAHLSDQEIVAASGTILAGFYTPYGILSVSAVELFQHPDVAEACRKDPGLWAQVGDELMRHKAHFNFFLPRLATKDVTLGGEKICAGQVLLPSLHAAATDPNLFSTPSVFNVHRVQPQCSIVFGAGPHFCPGAALSRQWLQVSLERLFTTLPGLRLAGSYHDLEWQAGSISMPRQVLVTWG
jgi:biflaviolin synthase